MIFIYYPLILISILGYGFFASSKVINIKNPSLGYQGIIGIFFLLLISYISTQFFAHNLVFNSLVLIIGVIFFFLFYKNFNIKKKNIKLLLYIFLVFFIFILVGKNHDDFHYYHFPYILTLVEFPHPIGLGNLNHGFKTHSSIFLLSSLFHLPLAKYNLFHLPAAYILIFTNFILLKLIFNKEILEKKIFISFLSLLSFIFINIFFYRLGEHGTDRSAMILIILLFVNLIYFINIKNKIDETFLKLFIIIFSIIISLKVIYIIYGALFIPLIFYLYKNKKSINIFFNTNILLCFTLFLFVILTNFFNTGCLLFPEKKTCFTNFSWSLPIEIVEYLNIHYENWAKAGSGAGYSISDSEKLKYISNFNWLSNWVDKYFFNKISDLLYSLIFITLIFIILFKRLKSKINYKRNYIFLFIIICAIFLIWFNLHPSLRYGGFHLFFLLFFLPLSLFLERYSKNILNLNKKIFILTFVTILIFLGRNVDRLIKEYKVNNYNPLKNIGYPLKDESFRIQKIIKQKIKDNEVKEVYKKRYIVY